MSDPAAPTAADAPAAGAEPVTARALAASPPDDLPVYRLLTGPDDAAFCRRVSAALALGYRLHGSPAATFNGSTVIVAQAVVWPGAPGTGQAA